MGYQEKSEHTTAEAIVTEHPLTDEAELIFEEYEKHRQLYQKLVLRGSDQGEATFKALRSIGLRLAEQIYMERTYAAAGKKWEEKE